jgi:hypothetical protein
MLRALILCLALLALPARAEGPNLSDRPQGGLGSASQLVLAQRAYVAALAKGEVLPLLAAIRLARGVVLRPAIGWTKTTTGEAPDGEAAQPEARPALRDPAGAEALVIARNLAGDDPDLRDLVYDLDAQVPRPRQPTAVEAWSRLPPGQADTWRLPLAGEAAAELAVISDTAGPLSVSLRDAGGAVLCTEAPTRAPVLCRLTPARNGFFELTVANPGPDPVAYRLIGN